MNDADDPMLTPEPWDITPVGPAPEGSYVTPVSRDPKCRKCGEPRVPFAPHQCLVSRDTPPPTSNVVALLKDAAVNHNRAQVIGLSACTHKNEDGEPCELCVMAVDALIAATCVATLSSTIESTPRSDAVRERQDGETWGDWVERVTGDTLTENQRSAVDDISRTVAAQVQAEHDTLIRAVAEWQEARTGWMGFFGPRWVDPFYSTTKTRYTIAENNLAAFPLKEGV